MTQEQRETIQHVLGIINGVCFMTKGGVSSALGYASDRLEELLEKED